MADIKTIKEELGDIDTINLMSGVLRDIAASRSKKLRDRYQHNTQFFQEVRDLYSVVRGLVRSKDEDVVRPKKALAITVTSNFRFYGGLNRQVVELFLDNFDKYDDHLVIGNTGGQYLGKTKYFQKCEYKSFDNDIPNTKQMRGLISRTEEYDRVDVYYPAFKNAFQQEPTVFDINAAPEAGGDENSIPDAFITEPDLDKLNDFFSTHVKWVLFQRVILETDLARTSARLMKMHSAEEASKEAIESMKDEIRRGRRETSNVQLLESIIALKQWQKLHDNK